MIQTSCKDCVFANWNENVQTGCSLNRLTLLENNGAKLEYEIDKDTGKKFYMINHRICMACRNGNWAKENKYKNLETIVRVQMTIRTDVFIPMDEDYKLSDFEKTIESIKQQDLTPLCVTGIINQKDIKPGQLMKLLKGNGFAWKVEHLKEKYSRTYAIETALRRTDAPYYAVFEPGFIVPKTFISDIDRAINDKGIRFSMLKGKNLWNCLVVQRKTHDSLADLLIEDENVYTAQHKILRVAEECGELHMIKNVEEICRLE